MNTKKAAAAIALRKEDHGTGGPRRYVLRPPLADPEPHYTPRAAQDQHFTPRLANHARNARTEPAYIPKARKPRKENPFQKHGAARKSASTRWKVTLPPEFVEWAESRDFSPAEAARFVLAWFTEREKVDKRPKVQYTCANTAWPTSAPRIKKMSP